MKVPQVEELLHTIKEQLKSFLHLNWEEVWCYMWFVLKGICYNLYSVFNILAELFMNKLADTVVIIANAVFSFTKPSSAIVCLCVAIVVILVIIGIFARKKKKLHNLSSSRVDIYDLAKASFQEGKVEQVIELLKGFDGDINQIQSGLSLLLCACLSGEKKLILHLIKSGGDLNVTTPEGDSALYLATFGVVLSPKPDVSVLQELIRRGCDVNVQNNLGYTPLHRAAATGNIPVINMLLEYGAEKTLKTKSGIYPIDSATNSGHFKAAELLKFDNNDEGKLWDIIEPHTPPNVRLGLQSPFTDQEYVQYLTGSSLKRRSIKRDILKKHLNGNDSDHSGKESPVSRHVGQGDCRTKPVTADETKEVHLSRSDSTSSKKIVHVAKKDFYIERGGGDHVGNSHFVSDSRDQNETVKTEGSTEGAQGSKDNPIEVNLTP